MTNNRDKRPKLVKYFLAFYLISTFILIITVSNSLKAGSAYIAALYCYHLLYWLSTVYLIYGLLNLKFSSWLLLYIQAGFILLFTLIIGNKLELILILNSINLVPLIFFFTKKIRRAYTKHQFRWWDQPERYIYELIIEMQSKTFYTYDISKKGAFIRYEEVDFEVGELIPIIIHIDNIKIDCFAEVIWVNRGESHNYPRGFALKYDRISHYDKQQLYNFIMLLQELEKEKKR